MRTLAMISALATQPGPGYEAAAEIVRGLQAGQHYTTDRAAMTASLTDDGIAEVERR